MERIGAKTVQLRQCKKRYFYIEKTQNGIYIYQPLCYDVFGEDWVFFRNNPQILLLPRTKEKFLPFSILYI